MRAVTFLLLAAVPASAQVERRKDFPIPAYPGASRTKPLRPAMHDSVEAAIESARRRGQVIVLAVGLEGEPPALFLDSRVARASRMFAALAAREYSSEDEFFKSRRVLPEHVPAVFLLDGYGNLLERRDPGVDPAVLVAAARSARTVATGLTEELPRVLERARGLEDEAALLNLLRPWLRRHLRGYPEVEALLELVRPHGDARLKAAADSQSELEQVARDYAHTPVEAMAWLEIAKLRRSRDDLRHVLDELAWPENGPVHEEARRLLAELRREEIERRRKELESREKSPR